MKENKDWKKELKDLYNSCGFDHVSNCGCFGECNCVDNLTKLENFIEQIISEKDKEVIEIIKDMPELAILAKDTPMRECLISKEYLISIITKPN